MTPVPKTHFAVYYCPLLSAGVNNYNLKQDCKANAPPLSRLRSESTHAISKNFKNKTTLFK